MCGGTRINIGCVPTEALVDSSTQRRDTVTVVDGRARFLGER